MPTTVNDNDTLRPNWLGQIAMFAIHAMGFCMVYVALVFIGPTFEEHYRSIGVASTSRFDAVMTASSWMASWTLAAVIAVALNGLLIHWLAQRDARLLSRYSHTLLSALGLATFVAFAWMIHPIVWNPPRAAGAPVATSESSALDSVAMASHVDD